MKTVILGCGSSGGVPRPLQGWGLCDASNPKNRRLRCSIYVEVNDVYVLIDTSPDLREQLIANNITKLDAVCYTHTHADQLHGIDDLRCFYLATKAKIPIYGGSETIQTIKSTFDYCFNSKEDYPAILEANIENDSFNISGISGNKVTINPFAVYHGPIETFGYRIGEMAYIPDVVNIEAPSLAKLQGLEVLIIDALRYKKHPTHFSLQEALEIIELLKPKKAYLTNMFQDLDYETLLKELPENVMPAYDGLTIESSY